MFNKKIASEFAIGIILISAILISGIFLWKDRNNTLVVDKQILQMKEAGVLNQIVEQKDDSQNDTRENIQQVSAVIDKLCKREMIGELHKCGKYFKSLSPAGLLDAPDNIYDVNGELIGFCDGMPGPDGPSNSRLCSLICQSENLCSTGIEDKSIVAECLSAGTINNPATSDAGTKNCCQGLKLIFGNDYEDCNSNKYLVGLPECAPCGNGICESNYGENHCSCSEDCSLNKTNKTKDEIVACTQEAKQCPDGSWVSRTGPKCEFAACK